MPTPSEETPSPQDKAVRLELLREQSLGCTRCKLATTRKNVVFGEGSVSATLMLVGKGVGENEDLTGRPFVGKSGKLLDQALERAGITRQNLYITSVAKCRSADHNLTPPKNREPEPDEVAACWPYLEQQLGLITPQVVVCLGGTAAETLIRKNFRITKERGQWFTGTAHAPWVLATVHPAFLLRQRGATHDAMLESFVADLALAKEKVLELGR